MTWTGRKSLGGDNIQYTLCGTEYPEWEILTRHGAPTWKDKIRWHQAEASFWSQTLVSWRLPRNLHVSRLWDHYTSLTDHQTVARHSSQTQTLELSAVWIPKTKTVLIYTFHTFSKLKLTRQTGSCFVKLTSRISLNPRHSSYTTFLIWGTSVKILRGLTQRKIISSWAPEFGGTFPGIQHRNTRLTYKHMFNVKLRYKKRSCVQEVFLFLSPAKQILGQ